MDDKGSATCLFCDVAAGRAPADVIWEDQDTLAFVDVRQPDPVHVLVVPRAHVVDAGSLDEATGAALMETVVRILRAVDEAIPCEGLSVWHSIGPAALQEMPHLHVHVLPRGLNDGLLQVYASDPQDADDGTRAEIARRIRERL